MKRLSKRRLSLLAASLAVLALNAVTHGEPTVNKGKPLPPIGKMPADAKAGARAVAARQFTGPTVTYRSLAGDLYFAFQVRPKLAPVPVRPRDYVIMVSASAAQAGVPWLASTQIAGAIVRNARAQDRVSLWVVSTAEATKCLTRDLLAAKTKAAKLQDALKKLKEKAYPAGATDLKSALTKAIESFDGRISRQRIILFLGDGSSNDSPLSRADRHTLAKTMIERKIAFFAVPLGDRLHPENLHGLCTGTGGSILRTQVLAEKLEDALKRYEQAFAAPVLYPAEFQLSKDVIESYPAQLPPLRGDTPTLVIGRVKAGKELTLTVKGTVAGLPGEVVRTQTEALARPDLENYFLVSMVTQWKRAPKQAAFLRADRALCLAYEQTRLQHQDLLLGAEMAVQKNQLEAAAKLFAQAKAMAPHDVEAEAGLKIVASLQKGKLTLDELRRQLNKGRPADRLEQVDGKARWTSTQIAKLAELDQKDEPAAGGGAAAGPAAAGKNDLLKARQERLSLEEQAMTSLIDANIREARRQLDSDPDAALELLRSALLRVRDHPDLSEAARTALLRHVQAALRDVTAQGRAIKLRKQQQQEIVAQAKKRRDDELRRQTLEQRAEAQYRVYKGLMNLARAEEITRNEVMSGLLKMQSEARLKGRPVPVSVQAAYDETLAGYHLQQNNDLKRRRREGFLATMLSVEKSHIPYPDEPGIFFPPLSTWEAIRKLRKEKYEAMLIPDDEKGRNEANAIKRVLEEPIEMKDFVHPMTLKEALAMLMEKFAARGKELPILVDTAAFKEENPDATSIYDTPVKFEPFPKQLQLATMLRLMLSKVDPPNATYLIRRNYIEITTIERQTRERVLRVYPVGDLVIPVSQQMGVLGAGGGLGFAGYAGFAGFSGFGFGGFGGMMMGGTMLGGFGGFNGFGGMMLGGLGSFNGFGGFGGFNGFGGFGLNGFGFNGFGGGFGGGFNGFGFNGFGFNGFGFNGFGMLGGGFGGFAGLGALGGGGGFPGFGAMGFAGALGGFGGAFAGGGFGGLTGFAGGSGGFFRGGSYMGSFNGGLGLMGGINAPSLLSTVTQVVAPSEWYTVKQPQPFNQFLGGGLNNFMGGVGVIGGQALGNMGNPPPALAQGAPIDPGQANTLQFFPASLALIVRGTSRIHTDLTGGLLGARQKRVEGLQDARKRPEPQSRAQARSPARGRDHSLTLIEPWRVRQKGGGKTVIGTDTTAPTFPTRKPLTEADPTTLWQQALEREAVSPGLVIATADFLFEAGKYQHAAEFLKANLRRGIVVRPWVFEALAVALEASGADAAEVRRARLSALDQSPNDPDAFLEAARTMGRHKQWDRALALCRQAAALEPNRAEPYAEALDFAERAKDSQAMEWAAGKLLAQDWPLDNEVLHARARGRVDSLIKLLEKGRRAAEATRLTNLLKSRRRRDLVITLSWQSGTDRADLDLIVKEPCGSVCSLQQRQTPGGGTEIGNTLAEPDRLSYMAAEALPGDYEIQVRSNWGQPLGRRARLEIIENLGTDREKRRLQMIRLDNAKEASAVVKLKLKTGRRTNLAVVPPPQPRRPRPAQQDAKPVSVYTKLRALVHPEYAATRIRPAAWSPGARPTAPPPQTQAQKPGQIVYQTAVAPLQSAVELNARAVLSADQRSMRLSLTPVFQAGGAGARPPSLSLIPGGD